MESIRVQIMTNAILLSRRQLVSLGLAGRAPDIWRQGPVQFQIGSSRRRNEALRLTTKEFLSSKSFAPLRQGSNHKRFYRTRPVVHSGMRFFVGVTDWIGGLCTLLAVTSMKSISGARRRLQDLRRLLRASRFYSNFMLLEM